MGRGDKETDGNGGQEEIGQRDYIYICKHTRTHIYKILYRIVYSICIHGEVQLLWKVGLGYQREEFPFDIVSKRELL